MLKFALCAVGLLISAGLVSGNAQSVAGQPESFRKEAPGLQTAVNEVINSTVPGQAVLQGAKATYLDGYGIVVTLEAILEQPRNPFSSPKTPAEVRKLVTERRKQVQDKYTALLKQRVPLLQSVGDGESLAVIVHLLNTNPADLPDLPAQLILSLKKQDGSAVTFREY
jgi:hypothetical protein